MTLAGDIEAYVADALRQALADLGMATATGTVATSPSQVSTDPLTVVMDGSAVAVPCKQLRAFPVFPGMRVALQKFGADWTVVGPFSDPGAGTGEQRLAIGADVPDELKSYGIQVALLMWDTDSVSGLEVGYFFIGVSNVLDSPPIQKVMLFGKVKYPTPGDPTSPTPDDVYTGFQINMDGLVWFKDMPVDLLENVPFFRSRAVNNYFTGSGWTKIQTPRCGIDSDEVWIRGRLFTNNVRTLLADGSVPATDTAGSTNNVLLPNVAITDITKELPGTRMQITVHGTAFKSNAGFGRMYYGVQMRRNSDNAVVGNYDIGRFGFSGPNIRYGFSNIAGPLAAIPAGSYTAQVYIRAHTAGTPQNTFQTGPEDSWSLKWEEVW
ncbi:hypothetical protein [Micromonospora globbae]|uniref:hypothetical protein n=1 Tax=Micromonospora globbae TaxID=1894969 RepID=UPI00344935A3